MFRISTKAQYGLRAMVYLAQSKYKVCPLKIISKKEGISFDYLEKIISKLQKTGLLCAKKGSKGGYSLAKQPSKIKIGEIIRALEGERDLVRCVAMDRKKSCYCPKERKCLAKNFWEKLRDSLNSTLNSITLADLINPEGPRPQAKGGIRRARK